MDNDLQQNIEEKVFFKIIIPNYNNMPYIKKCLDSILEQTFQDFKIIIVDDMSTDLSDKFCEMYARRYPDKIVYKQLSKKGFAGAARNAALDLNIKSHYTYFLDSDDMFYDINSLYNIFIVSKSNPDLIECSYVELKQQKQKIIQIPKNVRDSLFGGVQPLKHCINSKFDYVRFKENRAKNNDMLWGIKIFDSIDDKKIKYTKNPITIYNKDSNTSCQNSNIKNDIQCVDAQIELINDLKQEYYKKSYCNEFKEITIKRYETLYKKYQKQLLIDDVFKNSFVISIDKNKYNRFLKIFKTQFGTLLLPKLFVGSQNKKLTGPQNCTLSHLNIVKNAKCMNLPYVMIFEDDAYPCIDVYNKFSMYLKYLPLNIKLLILGWSNHSQLKEFKQQKQQFNKHINNITTIISGSHAYILFKEGYDDYINFFTKNPNATADCHVFYKIQPSYILNKPLFIQYSNNKSMNNHVGYIYYGDHKTPPIGFKKIENML